MTTTIVPTATVVDASEASRRPRWPMIAGFGYLASWVIGLSAFGVGPGADATDLEVSQYFADHRVATSLQSLLIHGVAAVALLTVLVASKRARISGHLAHAAGLTAVALSLVQLSLDLWRSAISTGTTTTQLVEAIDRVDGLKMFALALMVAAGVPAMRAAGVIAGRMAFVGRVSAVALVVSGIAYGAAIDGLVISASLSLVLLLGWVAFQGVAAGRRSR